MNIAIYGDSFAVCPRSPYRGSSFFWGTTLAKKLNATVTNFAKNGTSVYHSYKLFLETYTNFDLCIFVVTEPNRYFKEIKIANDNVSIGNLDQLNVYKNLVSTAEEKLLLKFIEGWFLSSDEEYNQCIVDLITSDMQTKKNNIIMYPSFDNSLPKSRTGEIISFRKMHMIQLQKMGKNLDGNMDFLYNENVNKLAAHFTESFNNFISDMLYKKITTGNYDFLGLDEIKVDPSIDYYDHIDKTKGYTE